MAKANQRQEPTPRDYWLAVQKYLVFQPGTVRDFAFRQQEWDRLEELARQSGDKVTAQRLQQYVQADIKLFQSQVTKAFRAKDIQFLQKLIRALKVPLPVEHKFSPVVATLRAFDELYNNLGCCLPSKQEVKELAARYLKERGWPPVGERQWPRILKSAGLQSLNSVKYGPALKRRKP